MAFQIVRCRMAGKVIAERSIAGTADTTEAAETLARTAAAQSAESGFDPDHGFWWGRSGDGTELRYFVEVAGDDPDEDE
jgi:hypothetical protein